MPVKTNIGVHKGKQRKEFAEFIWTLRLARNIFLKIPASGL